MFNPLGPTFYLTRMGGAEINFSFTRAVWRVQEAERVLALALQDSESDLQNVDIYLNRWTYDGVSHFWWSSIVVKVAFINGKL